MPCQRVINSAEFRRMVSRSTKDQPPPSTNYEYLTYVQLTAVTRKHVADKKALRSQVRDPIPCAPLASHTISVASCTAQSATVETPCS